MSEGDKDWMQFKSKNDISFKRVTKGKFGEYD